MICLQSTRGVDIFILKSSDCELNLPSVESALDQLSLSKEYFMEVMLFSVIIAFPLNAGVLVSRKRLEGISIEKELPFRTVTLPEMISCFTVPSSAIILNR